MNVIKPHGEKPVKETMKTVKKTLEKLGVKTKENPSKGLEEMKEKLKKY